MSCRSYVLLCSMIALSALACSEAETPNAQFDAGEQVIPGFDGGPGFDFYGGSTVILDPAGRIVALKVLRPHVAHDEDARSRLAREVDTLARVRSDRIAPVFDADLEGERPRDEQKDKGKQAKDWHRTHRRFHVWLRTCSFIASGATSVSGSRAVRATSPKLSDNRIRRVRKHRPAWSFLIRKDR